ncbi:MAG: Fur family transcriptional regulator [Dehalococcoidia bacterium]
MRPTEEHLTEILSSNGYKITPQRRAVLKAIAGSREHLTPAAVYKRAAGEDPKVGLVTVYRTLEMLSELGLICRVHRGGRSRSYTLAPIGHHHHLICTECGAVTDFTDCDLGELERRLSSATGFKIEGHLLEFFGICGSCQKKYEGNS